METRQVLLCFEKIFGRKASYMCIPCNELDNIDVIKKYPLVLCINDMPNGHPGQHWVGIYVESKQAPLEFFCSYGRSLRSYGIHFVNFLTRHNLKLSQKYMMLQSPFSTLCGWYVVYYMFIREKRRSPYSFYAMFSKNVFNNDKIISNFSRYFIETNKIKFN